MDEYHIIADDKMNVVKRNIERIKVAVLIHLFYEDQIVLYQEYIKKIPAFIDIIIISSKDTILEMFDNTFIKIKKINRGRDISALLVAAGEVIFEYEYICFVHDKKEKELKLKADTEYWVKNLWDNMLQSEAYVYNILDLLANNDKLGMLAPLPPHGREFGTWLNRTWGPNYEKTKKLADELAIRTEICRECPPITYGTVFWAKTKALRKLFIKDWKYEDFPLEPMKNNGEINHAVERILQYVVMDAGYETKIVLSSSFAAAFINKLHDELNDLWEQMDLVVGIRSYEELEQYHSRIEKIKKFKNGCEDIYLYGIGRIGRRCLRICRILDIIPKGIIVTKPDKEQVVMEDIPVIGISELVSLNGAGIIISAGKGHREEMENELKKRGITSYIFF